MKTQCEQMRVCKKCGQEKPLESFVKDSRKTLGRSWSCRECRNAYLRKWSASPRARRQIAVYRRANSERHAEYSRAYRQRYPDRIRESFKRLEQANPEKRKAYNTLNNAVRDGRIEKLPCEVCGNPDTDGHHADYSKPLEVRWLCHAHHFELEHTSQAEIVEVEKKRKAPRKRRVEEQARMF